MNTTDTLVILSLVIIFPTMALGAIRRPAFGLAVLVFSLPILSQGRRLFLGNQMPILSLETIAVIVLWIFVQLHNLRNRPLAHRDLGVVAAVIIFLLAGFLSAFFAHDSEIAIKIFLAGGLAPILCFFIAKNHIRNKDDILIIILGFFGLVIQVAIFTALAWGKRQTIMPQDENLVAWLYQNANPVIIFGSPSASIATIVSSIPLSAWYRVYGRWQRNLIWAIVSVSTIGVAAMSLSRGSWLGLLVALIISLPLYFKRIQVRIVLLASLLLTGFYYSGIFGFFVNLFSSRLSMPTNTIDIRLANYQLALQSSTIHVFLGLGPGNYQYVYREFPLALASRLQPLWFAHNLFLTLIPEIGLLGAIAFAYIFISRFVKNIKNFQKSTSENRWLIYSILVGIISYTVVVSTSGGHLVASLTNYLIAPGLIVTFILMGILSENNT